ncbi:MAG: S4 domain-containing protein [Rhodovarius sp.]|nr:S4 domain-containing protein [Rhodovarius sp.]MDW8315816.1 S4 domain-containing protein [Rhodovarius sp.]
MERPAEWERLDVWLWRARLARSRSACARAVAAGGFRVNRQPVDKPHHRLRVGDVVTFAWGSEVRIWRVLSLGSRRGPPAEARSLYEVLSPGVPPSAA